MEQELTKKERKEFRRKERRQETEKQKRSRGLKRFALWGGAPLVLALGAWGVIALVPEPPETYEDSSLPVLTEQDHIKGAAAGEVVLVEYGDFQCPACRSYLPMLNQLQEDFGGRVTFVYRHYPLRSIHPQAQAAARASEAAALQGKFWAMHDMLFENQSEWAGKRNAQEMFAEYAAALELDRETFQADLESDAVKDKVQQDFSGGNVAGVPGTPTFFLNGTRISNPQNYNAFKAILEQALSS